MIIIYRYLYSNILYTYILRIKNVQFNNNTYYFNAFLFQVKIGNNIHLSMYTILGVCSKLLKFGNLIFLGDTHIRYKFRYLIECCHKSNPGYNSLKQVSNKY